MATKKKKRNLEKKEIFGIDDIDFQSLQRVIKRNDFQNRLCKNVFDEVIYKLGEKDSKQSKLNVFKDNFEKLIKSFETYSYGLYDNFWSLVKEYAEDLGGEELKKKYIVNKDFEYYLEDKYYEEYIDLIENIIYDIYNEIKYKSISQALREIDYTMGDFLPVIKGEKLYKSLPKEQLVEYANAFIEEILPESFNNIKLGEKDYPFYEDGSGIVIEKEEKDLKEVTLGEYLDSYTGNWTATFEPGYGRLWSTLRDEIRDEIYRDSLEFGTEHLFQIFNIEDNNDNEAMMIEYIQDNEEELYYNYISKIQEKIEGSIEEKEYCNLYDLIVKNQIKKLKVEN